MRHPRLAYSEDVVFGLLHRIYDAALHPDRWPAFLDLFSDTTHGTFTSIFHQDLTSQHGSLASMVRIGPEFAQLYEHYSTMNPWLILGKDLVWEGNVCTGRQMCPDELVLNTEYYADFLRPYNVFHHFGGNIFSRENRTANITVMRPRSAVPFGEIEMSLLRILMPHLKRALQLHTRLSAIDVRAGSVFQALDQLPHGVVILDGDGRILHKNRASAGILDQRDGLRLCAGGFECISPRETVELSRIIHEAMQTACGAGAGSGGAMAVSRLSGKRPYGVLVIPLKGETAFLPESAGVAIFLSDPEARLETPEQWFQRLYRLTKAEARLVNLLLEGKGPQDATELFGVSRNTVHAQLQSIYAKTGARRQSELVRLLLLTHFPARTEQD